MLHPRIAVRSQMGSSRLPASEGKVLLRGLSALCSDRLNNGEGEIFQNVVDRGVGDRTQINVVYLSVRPRALVSCACLHLHHHERHIVVLRPTVHPGGRRRLEMFDDFLR